jgi:carbonic anhydrase
LERLDSIAANSDVVIDASDTEYVDHDVLEIIREFAAVTAPSKQIRLTLLGFKDRYTLNDKVEWLNVLSKDAQQKLTPDEVLSHLRQGNERFASGNPLVRDLIQQHREVAASNGCCAELY